MPVKKGCVTEAEAARHKTCTLPTPAGVPVVARGPPDPDVLGKVDSATTLAAT